MERHGRHCKCKHKKCKCQQKCKIKIIPAATGPTGPIGPVPTLPVQRVLKVQLLEGVPTPTFIEGFDWENNVPEPDNWPVVDTFTFYKATVLDISPYPIAELYTVAGAITHGDLTPFTDHQVVIAHYRNGVLLDFHSASSQLLGIEDFLIAQTLQNALIGDCFYFAISPAEADLINFNYTLGSLAINQGFKIPDNLPISVPTPGSVPANNNYIALVTVDTDLRISMSSGGGGGGMGGTSSVFDSTITLGRGGAGGNSGVFFGNTQGLNPALSVTAGSCLEWTLGTGGKGGDASDGADGTTSTISLKGVVIPDASFLGINPAPGGLGSQSGENGGSSPSTGLVAGTGGGGGAPLINGTPGASGAAGVTVTIAMGTDGGTNPRTGGDGGFSNGGGTGGTGGSTAGPNTSNDGSGGGGGAGSLFAPGGVGGNGSEPGSPPLPGTNGGLGAGGGGGGSAGLPTTETFGGRGGDGGPGFMTITL